MKKLLLLLCFFACAKLKAQTSIELKDIATHVGDSVTVKGKVFTARYFESSKDAPSLLNIGAAFPNQLLTVVVYGNNRSHFKNAPETFFLNKEVIITGKVQLYKGKPQIVVDDETQLKEAVQ